MATWLSSCIHLYLFILVLSLHKSPLRAIDTITANQPLSGYQKLISEGGRFALGFFQPAGSTGKWYIGIWYNKIRNQTVVWVANRDRPISDPTSSNLTISNDGNVVLLSHSAAASPVWSTNTNNTAPSPTVAVLLNTGNLIVRHQSNASHVIWQSFDHFTDTWLPGSKIGRNKLTGVIKRMISWKDHADPAPGAFTFQLDPDDPYQYILIWNNSIKYSATGKWTGNAFSAVPELSAINGNNRSEYTFQFVDDDQETYLTYTVNDGTLLTRIIIDVSGLFQAFEWAETAQEWLLYFSQPKAKCNVYGMCGPYSKCTENASSSCRCLKGFSESNPNNWKLGDQTAGCKRNVPLQCGDNGSAKAEKDRFYVISNVRLPDMAQSTKDGSIRDCEYTCMSNCSCTAYSYKGTCSLWFKDLLNLKDGADSIFIRLAASELPDPKTKKWWIIGIIIGGLAILGFGVTALYFILRRRRISVVNSFAYGSLITFKYSDLQLLTKNFSEKLGVGSFGPVFKGVLPDATVVAVKKLEGVRQGEKQFQAEVSTVGTIHHINLVRLLGFCSQGARRLLVYEYMPNGSLDQHLFVGSSITLSWNTRYQIALGIAKGLAYLHNECRDCIIHCDIKPENILLDMSFVPKVADFGMAKLLGRDFSRVLTSMRGTIGYLAPEWISSEAITTKADVFSYGMMLFEIVSGKRNVEQGETSTKTFFPVLVARKLLEGDVKTLLTSELANDVQLGELERACKVACWCVQEDVSSRPAMREIVQILEGLVHVEMPPMPRYLQVLAEGCPSCEIPFR